MSTHEEGREYDIIFAGGGTAACVAAGRLAKADPSLSILVVEGGKNNLNDPTITNPAAYLVHLAPDSKTALFYKANKEKSLNDRESIVPSGGVLGGGSSINFMMYTRAQGIDFDSWKTEGWDANSLVPLAKKLETYHLDDPSIDQSLHGHDGPINVSFGPHNEKGPQDDFLAAVEAIGFPEIPDMQDFRAIDEFSRWARYVDPAGKRQDTAHRYIHPLLESSDYPNLHILVETKVGRVIFEGTRAVGIETEPNRLFHPATPSREKLPAIIRAKKLVVVSAGALGTPSVLERSGVGSAEILKKLDIDVISDLPDVGEHYQDHNLILYPYKTSLKVNETLDVLLSGRLDFQAAVDEKNPLLGWNGIDVTGKIRPSDAEVKSLGPEFEEHWNRDFKDQKEKPLMLICVVSAFLGDRGLLEEENDKTAQYASMATYTGYPYSRGNIHIVSKDAQTPASFNTGFLSHPVDLTKLVWAYKKQREIYRRTSAFAGELAIGHPKFRQGSKAALSEGPLVQGGFKSAEERRAIADIEYDADDDAAIEDWIRSNVATTWHSVGTCRMAPREEGGVLDKHLNVYGTEGLKVADLSILPENVGANTNNTALIVGEKAAEIIGKELGISV